VTNTPLSEQPKIVLFGLRNAGKSSLVNNIFGREVSIVSNHAGTTTDPVTRSFELGKLGSVAIIDTAGFDDVGELGNLRVKKTIDRLEIADIVILVSRGDTSLTREELEIIEKYQNKNLIIAFTFADGEIHTDNTKKIGQTPKVFINNITGEGIDLLKNTIIELFDHVKREITPVEGLTNENDLVILVTPIDLAAPKGRLILPQVETIRDLLDKDCSVLIVKERELRYIYDKLGVKPKLVITDSQVFNKVAADIPEDQMLTSFSILFARKKGDLAYFVEGAKYLKNIKPEGKILVLESCNHHKQADDIGTVKIPRLFKQLAEPSVTFEFAKEIPSSEKLKEYQLVINCAGCMVTKNDMTRRLDILKNNQIHATNYGLFLAWAFGVLPRALEPFPYEYNLWINN